MYCLSECGTEGNRHALLSRFLAPVSGEVDPKTGKPKKSEALKKCVRTMTATMSEQSLSKRLDKVRGFGGINQVTRIHVVIRQPLVLNHHSRPKP